MSEPAIESGSGSDSGHGLLARAFLDAADGAAPDQGNAVILAAARELFLAQGVQRTTMEDIAQRAGVSRITIYRRTDSKEALLEQVVLGEFRRYFDDFVLDIAGARTLEERVVRGFVGSLRSARNNPLIGQLWMGGTTTAPTILGEGGRTVELVRSFVAGQLRREQEAGLVGDDIDVEMIAEIWVRLCGSFLLSPDGLVDIEDDEQLAHIARTYLLPMLQGAPRS